MKSTILSIIAACALLVSCDSIDKEDYLLHVDAAAVNRAVLIEDFTGQNCSNCPDATATIDTLKKQYGEENIIAVAIHTNPKGYAGTAKYAGLMINDSEAYGVYWGINSQPMGLINRVGNPTNKEDWGTMVYDAIQKPAEAAMKLETQLGQDAAGVDTVGISVYVTALTRVNAKLQLWLVEDSIPAYQKYIDKDTKKEKYDYGYVHHHVFRGAINGLWGDAIVIEDGKTSSRHYTFRLDGSTLSEHTAPCVPANCSVVAFVYNDNGVLQVTKSKIKQHIQKSAIRHGIVVP